MKHVYNIISHLTLNPSFKKIEQAKCYKKLLALLPKKLSEGVRFAYNKNRTLFLVLQHPGYKFEFDYKLDMIKTLLKKLIEVDANCSIIDADEVKTFVTNKPSILKNDNKIVGPFYIERSSGNFEINIQDESLRELFEQIREKICSNKQ